MIRTVLAAAAVAAMAAAAPRADVIDILDDSGAALEPLGTVGTLDGWHVTPADGAPYTLYVAPSGHAVVGLLYDPAGALVTAEQLAASPPPHPMTASAQPPDAGVQPTPPPAPPADGAAGFRLGRQGPFLRVFADPACPWSRSAVANLASEALAGRIVIEVVPVALIGAESARMALAAVAGGAEAWFSQATADPVEETAVALLENNAIFAESGGTAVPYLLWQNDAGITRSFTGAPEPLDAFLKELGR